MLNPITEEDQFILDWFESQSEETLRDLSDRFDAGSPREFWTAFLADCTPPAQECPGDSLAAPAEAGQGVCICPDCTVTHMGTHVPCPACADFDWDARA